MNGRFVERTSIVNPSKAPFEVRLEFLGDEEPFTWSPKKYSFKHTGGVLSSIEIPWDRLQHQLEALSTGASGAVLLEQFGLELRQILVPTVWPRLESKVIEALAEGRPVHLTLYSDRADEIFHLPWELLNLTGGRRLGTLASCLIQYECATDFHSALQIPPTGRILFAYSEAGGNVPFSEHMTALEGTCRDAGLYFDPDQDVIPHVNQSRLAAKMADASRPVTALHLLCHGGSRNEDGAKYHGLIFDPKRDDDSESDFVDAAALRHLLFESCDSRALRLVTICACQGGDAGTPGLALESNARMLHRQGIPAVLASRLPLTCRGSITFTKTLYQKLLVCQENMRTALASARSELARKEPSHDAISIQLYARAGDARALLPFSAPPSPSFDDAPPRELVLIRHSAYSTAHGTPTPQDTPALFAGKRVRPVVSINQAPMVSERRWENLEPEVAKLAARDGVLRRTLEEPDTDIVYFGFPYVSFAAFVGYLAKNRHVDVLEYDRSSGRFMWHQDEQEPVPPLKTEAISHASGTAAQVRISISAIVQQEECERVLPASNVNLDLHFFLEQAQRGIVRRASQLREYVNVIRRAVDFHIAGNSGIDSIHVFAAVPVSVAFHLGQALAFTGLPDCFIYNFDARDPPRYKWCMHLQAAGEGRSAIKLFSL
ncbi:MULTISPECIES: SAVED domain-containing protein [Myxococcus]|uniref:SAVED domain-containing protein n=1 Tax=Myxococcus TaxID=32 RepID=UPI0011441AF9|nr:MULTISPECIES: SAVED domain-containing protein [Myxococcus]NOK03986.1 SAVED domain-containing protein [Myxococcus xanthus]